MNLTAYEIALIAGGFGIVGTLLGTWITYRFSNTLIHITEFNKAAAEFQCAFLEAMQKLRDEPKADFLNILNTSTLLEHERAALRFKAFLSHKDQKRFENDWETYFSHRPHPGDRRFPIKTPVEWNNEENCKIFIKQIEKLLSYAKLK